MIKPGRVFVTAPFRVTHKAIIRRNAKDFSLLRERMREVGRVRYGNVGFPELMSIMGFGTIKRHGLILDPEALVPLLTAPTSRDPATEAFRHIANTFNVGDSEKNRQAQVESLKIIKQLHSLGYPIKIQDSRLQEHRGYINAAERAGAVKVPSTLVESPLQKHVRENILPRMIWARDQWVKMGKKKITIGKSDASLLRDNHIFGEGGTAVPIGPREFAIAQNVYDADPRIPKLEREGYKFHPMPDGEVYDVIMSDLFGHKIYTTNNHIDFVLGGVPEKKVVAIDPRYLKEHRLAIDLMKRNMGIRGVVEVPEEEADRHPACFLPLGNGKVMIDKGAPKFIKRMREAGVRVIPTAVPLNSLLSLKGGLHCLFNED